MEDFGIIIACYEKDYRFAKGCCASIRYFLGDVPICLLVDGAFSTTEVQKAYDVSLIYRDEVKHEVLRNRSFGYGRTKMVAFWESPFEYFMFIDADTIVWGNILKFADFKDFDFIVDQMPIRYINDKQINKSFFDTKKIEKYFPDFNWRSYRERYFITGVFFSRRGIFNLDEYVDILDFCSTHQGVFKFGEQGFLNFMIFSNVAQGKFRVKNEELQVFGSDFIHNPKLKTRFSLKDHAPAPENDDAAIIHWAGGVNSPFLARSEVYTDPMTFFRRKCLQDYANIGNRIAMIALHIEDLWPDLSIYGRKLAKKVFT